MAMTKISKMNLLNADSIHIERTDFDENIWLIRGVTKGHFFYVPCNYTSREGARRAVLRLKPTAPIFDSE